MSAKNKQELIELATKEFAKLETMIAGIDAQTAGIADADGISIKDTLAHRAHWVDLLLKWQADGKAGLPEPLPCGGYVVEPQQPLQGVELLGGASIEGDAKLVVGQKGTARLQRLAPR